MAKYLKRLWKDKDLSGLLDVLDHDDYTLMNDMRIHAMTSNEDDNELQDWAQRIFDRKHHTTILDTTHFVSANQRQGMGRIHAQLTTEFTECDFILGLEAKGSIHKFYVPGEPEMAEMFRVISDTGDRIITEESRIIRQMPKNFHVVRLYAVCPSQALLAEIRQKAQELGKVIKE